ncbi:uncharacterized protein VTP21DRAFT_10075 [Calcarisporiella thermophila]|uniref:uncharacterized protein n=1 Tax=Calcarisporiella thermophila TaxID=911321 RepID=UPI003742EC35
MLPPSKYKIADPTLASFGRREIILARAEMPGLFNLGTSKELVNSLKGARIAVCLPIKREYAVLIETLIHLGAEVAWASNYGFGIEDEIAAAMVAEGVPVFAFRGATDAEYMWCMEQVLTAFENNQPPNLLIESGGDLLKFVCEHHPQILPSLRGISEDTAAGNAQLTQLFQTKTLQTQSAINIASSVIMGKIIPYYSHRDVIAEFIKRATDIMIAGKLCVILGFGHVGKGCAAALRNLGARIVVTEIDPICALQATMEGYKVTTLENVMSTGNIFVVTTGCPSVIGGDHMMNMREDAVLLSVGNGNEIDVAWLEKNAVESTNIKPNVDRYTLPTTRHVFLLARGRPLFQSVSFGKVPSSISSYAHLAHVLSAVAMWNSDIGAGVQTIPKTLEERLARILLSSTDNHLTQLKEQQAAYLGISECGPFKSEFYRY